MSERVTPAVITEVAEDGAGNKVALVHRFIGGDIIGRFCIKPETELPSRAFVLVITTPGGIVVRDSEGATLGLISPNSEDGSVLDEKENVHHFGQAAL